MIIENKSLKVNLNCRLDTHKESINKLDGKKIEGSLQTSKERQQNGKHER